MVTSLLSSSSPWNPPPPMYPHPQRKKGNSKDMLRLYFAIISVFVFLPVLYLHSRLMGGDDGRHHHRPIHKKLGEFKSKRSQRDFLFAAARKQLQEQSSSTKKLKNNEDNSARPKFLTAYLEPAYDNDGSTIPFSIRNTTASLLTKVEFPNVCCADDEGMLQNFPIDNYPTADPFLPWIHDYFPNLNNTHIQFVAQNRRRCDTGEGMEKVMKFWEPQIALFQPIGVVVVNENSYRLATSFDEATHNATRFQCRFHSSDRSSQTTFSIYPFDYEYVHWRKKKSSKPMYQDEDGAQDMGNFWLSSLLFSCPIPTEFQNLKQYYLDLIPIRTPARKRLWFSPQHTGPSTFPSVPLFDAKKHFGTQHFLPDTKSAGRWANLPICRRATMAKPKASIQEIHRNKKPYRLVACTWTSASYTRRGDAVRVGDSARRLEEWIHFHLLVGFEHIYVYDNSDIDFNSTTLKEVAQQFGPERVTYHPWPCKVCNNNRPAHKNPGERSSQYAAEASCRERYGPLTEWMTFLDTDEYLVPMKKNEDDTSYTWHTILDEMDQLQVSVMKFLSSRSKPRIDLME